VEVAGNAGNRESGLLYPMLLIAALTATVFSIVAIVTMLGWMPRALAGQDTPAVEAVRQIESAVEWGWMAATGGGAAVGGLLVDSFQTAGGGADSAGVTVR